MIDCAKKAKLKNKNTTGRDGLCRSNWRNKPKYSGRLVRPIVLDLKVISHRE
jgi:hypothetical protein